MAKALIVEDDRTAASIIKKVVLECGLEPVYCSNGQLGWDFLRDNPDTAILIVDMVMPGLSGRELLAQIETRPELLGLPVIVTSGVVSIKEIDDILQLGARRFLPKPIDIRILRDYLASVRA